MSKAKRNFAKEKNQLLETLLQQRYEDLIWQPISFLEEKENPILRKSL